MNKVSKKESSISTEKIINKKISFFKLVFLISLLYYVFWIIISIQYSITGISSEYVGIHIESLCNHSHTIYYGMDAFWAGIENGFISTVFLYWFIPLYQVIYIIGCIIGGIINYFKKSG